MLIITLVTNHSHHYQKTTINYHHLPPSPIFFSYPFTPTSPPIPPHPLTPPHPPIPPHPPTSPHPPTPPHPPTSPHTRLPPTPTHSTNLHAVSSIESNRAFSFTPLTPPTPPTLTPSGHVVTFGVTMTTTEATTPSAPSSLGTPLCARVAYPPITAVAATIHSVAAAMTTTQTLLQTSCSVCAFVACCGCMCASMPMCVCF